MKRVVLLATAGGLALAGCGGGVAPVEAGELGAMVTVQFSQVVGGELPPTAVCDGDLAGTAGATQSCHFSWRGDDYAATVTMGDDGQPSVDIDPPPPPLNAGILEKQVAADYATRNSGETPASSYCPEHFEPEVGRSQVCTLRFSDGSEVSATLSIIKVRKSDGYTSFDVQYSGRTPGDPTSSPTAGAP